MATSKDKRGSAPDSNPFVLNLFRTSTGSRDRQRIWMDAVRHAGTGDPPLRFPVYEHLYLLNVYAQKMVELLEELSLKFAVNTESLAYHQSLIQYVRASACLAVMGSMSGIEETEDWIHQSQQRVEEEKRRDPDDLYTAVREREAERLRQKLPPRIQFLDQPAASGATRAKSGGTRRAVKSGHARS
jgi:hypothetical protein